MKIKPYLSIPAVVALVLAFWLPGCGGDPATGGGQGQRGDPAEGLEAGAPGRTLPEVVEARVIGARRVLVEFAEPAGALAELPTSYSVVGPDSEIVTVEKVELNDARIEATLTTAQELGDEAIYELLIDGADGAILIRPFGPPRLVGAISTSNTTVTVTFNKKMGDSAEVASNYVIVQQSVNSEVGALGVVSASFMLPQKDAVELTTLPQNEVTYELRAVNVLDASDNQLAPSQMFLQPDTTTFAGTPFSCGGSPCDATDSDGDGLPDMEEQRGYVVTLRLINGETTSLEVSSDPFSADTDGDGLGDAEEKSLVSNPRSADTDGDELNDYDEYNVYYSDPVNQDTDQDGLDDGLEVVFYRTSPVLADTDGDGFSDFQEVLEYNRNPRIADLPRPAISVGNMRMQIDERYTTTTEQGESISMESSSSTTMAQSQDRTFASSETDINSNAREMFIQAGIGASATISVTPEVTASISAEGGISWKQHSEHTTQFSAESTVSAQEVYEQSLAKGRELSKTTTVTREVVAARVDVDLTIENAGDIAFAISNIEISMLQSTGLSRTDFTPIGTLISNTALISGEEPTFNLGPFTEQLGPLVFGNRDIFPNEVDALLREPRGLIFRVANYDITDEFGRNFAFASQTARDRTAGITIDYGDGTVDRFLVATAGALDVTNYVGGGFVGGFDPNNGAPLGLPLDFILQDTLGMTKNGATPDAIVAGGDGEADSLAQGDDIQRVPQLTTGLTDDTIVISAGANGVLDTTPSDDDQEAVTTGYATSATCNADTPLHWDPNDPDILLNGPGFACESDADCGAVSGACSGRNVLVRMRNRRLGDFNRVWAVFASGMIPAGADFGQIVLLPGDDITVAFIQDLDRDGLFAREEYLYGSSDRDKDSDMDGIGDFAEVRVGWDVGVVGGDIRQVLPDPRVPDSDGDGLLDTEEQDLRRLWCRCSGGASDGESCGEDGECPGGTCSCTDNYYACDGGEDDGLPCSCDQSCASPATCEAFSFPSDCCIGHPYPETGCDDSGCQAAVCAVDTFCCDTWWDDTCGDKAGIHCSLCDVITFDEVFNGALPSDGPMRSDPRNPDTDSDDVSDMDEIAGYLVGVSVRDPASGGNDTADTQALSDDVQKVFVGQPVGPSRVVVLPGPNGVIDSALGGDDVLDPGVEVVTDPLNPDHDADTRPDGFERETGSDPTDANDSDDFLDSDRDGMSDAAEENVGWTVTVAGQSPLQVFSSKFVADTDFDGLPDLLEREIKTDPTRADTDNDGLDDFDEFINFAGFLNLSERFPGFVLDGTGSLLVGTDPLDTDTDDDGLTDLEEATGGWMVIVGSEVFAVTSDPLRADTDLDGLNDLQEKITGTDPRNPDTDGDGAYDGAETISDPLVPDLVVEVLITRIVMTNGAGLDHWMWQITGEIVREGPEDRVVIFDATHMRHCRFPDDNGGVDPGCNPNIGGSIIPGKLTIFQPDGICSENGKQDWPEVFSMRQGDVLKLRIRTVNQTDICGADLESDQVLARSFDQILDSDWELITLDLSQPGGLGSGAWDADAQVTFELMRR